MEKKEKTKNKKKKVKGEGEQEEQEEQEEDEKEDEQEDGQQGRIHGRQMRPPRYLLTRAIPYRPSLITPFPAPTITSYHFPSPCAIPDGLDG